MLWACFLANNIFDFSLANEVGAFGDLTSMYPASHGPPTNGSKNIKKITKPSKYTTNLIQNYIVVGSHSQNGHYSC